jgi:hypothetical protein
MVYESSTRYYGGGGVGGEPRSEPLRCFDAVIATVVKGSRWGAWAYSRYAFRHRRRCPVGDGIDIEHKIHARWYVFWEGSEGYPPTRTTRQGSITLKGVPRFIARDLTARMAAHWAGPAQGLERRSPPSSHHP